jgi:hypothetical protein
MGKTNDRKEKGYALWRVYPSFFVHEKRGKKIRFLLCFDGREVMRWNGYSG